MAEHFRDNGVRAAAITYGLTVTAAAICPSFGWFYAAIGRRLIAERVDQSVVDGMTRSVLPGVPIVVAATLVALWSPYTRLALIAALALFYVLGSSLFGATHRSRAAWTPPVGADSYLPWKTGGMEENGLESAASCHG